MKKEKKELTRSERRDTKTMRIKNIHIKLLKETGEGDQQKGFEKIIRTYQSIKKNPEELCMAHMYELVRDVEYYYNPDYIPNIGNLCRMIQDALRQGGILDPSILDPSILDAKPESKKSTNTFVEDKKHTKTYTSLIKKMEKK